jgi:hypothetical protein
VIVSCENTVSSYFTFLSLYRPYVQEQKNDKIDSFAEVRMKRRARRVEFIHAHGNFAKFAPLGAGDQIAKKLSPLASREI